MGGCGKSFLDRPHLQWSDGGKYTSSMIPGGDYPAARHASYRERRTPDITTKEEIQAMIDAGRDGRPAAGLHQCGELPAGQGDGAESR